MASIPPILGNLSPNQSQQGEQFNPTVDDQTKPLGDNFENLAKSLQLWLWDLLMKQELADDIPRRNEIYEILKRKLYYRGDQYWWYSESTGNWNPPNVMPAGISGDEYDQPAFQNVTNIFRSFGESLQSVLSQNNTAARFWPKSASNPEDVETAKNASKAVDLIHQKNDWQNLMDDATYFMNTDGFLGAYVRYVSDAQRYGSDEMTVLGMQEVPVGPPSVNCPNCGYQDDGSTDQNPTCANCAQPNMDVPAPTAQVPVPMGTVNVPKGQECISMVPALNLRRSMYANEQHEFLYFEWVYDLHKAKAISDFPWVADKIRNSSGSVTGSGTADSVERFARRILYLGSGRHSATGLIFPDLGVMRHAWIRPCLFEVITDENARNQLKSLYPEGAYVAFYNDVYCASRSECMDEHWETMQTCDGEGQARPTLISSILPIQEQLNDGINLLFEQVMNGTPEGFADQNTLDFEARNEQVAAPGNVTPVDLQPGADIRSKVMFSPAVEPSQALMAYIQQLFGEIPQFLTGAYPALTGGNTGSNDTASGISIQRNQAMARIGRAWRRLQVFTSNLDGKAVNCFQKNMTQDVEIPKENGSGYESDYIRISDMQGEVLAYPEVDSQYPVLQADIRDLVMSLLNEGNPLFMAAAQDPEALQYVFTTLGLVDMPTPGSDQIRKTNDDIKQLIQERPAMSQPQPAPPPMPGQPPQPPIPPQPIPSVEPDPLVDNISIAQSTAKKWLISDEGQMMKKTQPLAYQNVYLYVKACDQFAKQAQFQQAAASQGLQDSGPLADLGGSQHIQAPPPEDPNKAEQGSPDSST